MKYFGSVRWADGKSNASDERVKGKFVGSVHVQLQVPRPILYLFLNDSVRRLATNLVQHATRAH